MLLVDPNTNPSPTDATSWTTRKRDDVEDPTTDTYAQWAASQGLNGGPDDDADRDNLTNFFEYLFGSLPTDASDAPLPSILIRPFEVDGVTDDYISLTYQQNRNAEGATLAIEITEDLIEWGNDPTATVEWSRTANGDGTDTVTHRFAEPVRSEDRQRYLRLRGVSP